MNILRMGSRDPEVILLQRLINEALVRVRPSVFLDEDGRFGRLTDAALRQFQAQARGPTGPLAVDGVAGPDTWRALGLVIEVVRRIAPIGQTTAMSCWAVSAGVASGRMSSEAPITAQLANDGGLAPDLPNLDLFARENGMRLMNHVPMDITTLLPEIRRGNIMLGGVWTGTNFKHMVAVTGYYAGPSAYSTMIRINDPDPMGAGSIVVTDYPTMSLRGGQFDPYALIAQ
jgi:Putative peptidoglycan binding domain